MFRPFSTFVLATAAATCVAAPLAAQLTIPERTHGMRTSTHAEVLAFIDSLQHHGANITVGTLGESPQGKKLPYVILARPMVTTPAAAHATGKPIFYVEGNIHAGEVEGKEAVQALMRDLTTGYLKPLLDSVIVLFVPIYNADGNDAMGPNDINRGEQEGPAIEGLRANGQGYDLNRDYTKQDAPETRASLAFITKWDPDLYMDLHTTDGSYHGYALTWSPGLNPNHNPTNDWVQDTVLEQVRQRLIIRDHIQTYPYGNFGGGNGTTGDPTGWSTYESLPRYGSNLQGMMRVSVLSEAMSHDNFMQRITSTYDFVLEVMRYLNEHKLEMRHREALTAARRPDSVVVRGNALASSPARMDSVLVENTRTVVEPRSDSATRANTVRTPAIKDTVGICTAGGGGGRRGGAGAGRGAAGAGANGRGAAGAGAGRGAGGGGRRGGGGTDSTRDLPEMTGISHAVWMSVRDRFAPVRKEAIPAAYVFDSSYSSVIPLMQRVGIQVDRVAARWTGPTGRFMVDSVSHPRPGDWQGHCAAVISGAWGTAHADTIAAGSYVVSTNQRFGVLAAFLLEPASEDGYTYWNFFDRGLANGTAAPVRRLLTLPVTLRVLPVR
ncbi:MAG TPA: M14 family zinc carboxypeptidase [Gemmatimonadales bacterium]|jgi:hypothetical protein|nr:M14 family zinc carboxypeptidase [Gemmatimonadales bacterium]